MGANPLALYGTAEPRPERRRLVAGSIACVLSNGGLRGIRWRGVEVLRGIAYLLRDGEWGTVPTVVEDLAVEEGPESFSAAFTLVMVTPTGRLEAVARIEAHSEGRLAFQVVATPDGDITTNRCGFVVLHPSTVAGLPLRVEKVDGRVERIGFPETISPSQPVFDIRALAHEPAPGLLARCRLEADLPDRSSAPFEMEDQRNWSDASFKTYVGSLVDPWPYRLQRGEPLTQRVELTVEDRRTAWALPKSDREVIRIGRLGSIRMPLIGTGVPPGVHRAKFEETVALRELGASWWTVETELDDPRSTADLAFIARLRRDLPARIQLDAAVSDHLTPDEAGRRVASLCRTAALDPDAVRLLPIAYLKSFQPIDRWPDLPPLEEYALAARRHFPRVLVGGGMFTFFTELNRKRQVSEGLDFIGHATCPIVHDATDESVMQTMEALPSIARSVAAIWPNLPYRLGPSALAARRNPYGTKPTENPQRSRIPLAEFDPRHEAAFGAAWTVAYAAAIAPLGPEVLSLHASHGPNGPYGAGCQRVVPAWKALVHLVEAEGACLYEADRVPSNIAVLTWAGRDGGLDLIVANLAAEMKTIYLESDLRSGAYNRKISLSGYEIRRLALGLK